VGRGASIQSPALTPARRRTYAATSGAVRALGYRRIRHPYHSLPRSSEGILGTLEKKQVAVRECVWPSSFWGDLKVEDATDPAYLIAHSGIANRGHTMRIGTHLNPMLIGLFRAHPSGVEISVIHRF
jgi:hypothetical protein